MKNSTILYVILCLNLLTSCKSYYLNKYCKPDDFTIIKDSVVYHTKDSTHIINRDSIVIIKGGSVDVEISPCDSNGILKHFKQTFKNGGNTVIIYNDSGKLRIKSDCEDQINVFKNLAEYYKHKSDSSKLSSLIHEKVVERPLSYWKQIKAGPIGDIVFGLFILLVVILIIEIKNYIKDLPHDK